MEEYFDQNLALRKIHLKFVLGYSNNITITDISRLGIDKKDNNYARIFRIICIIQKIEFLSKSLYYYTIQFISSAKVKD